MFDSEVREKKITSNLRRKLVEFVTSHKDLDDSQFHAFSESLGIEPHEAEEVIYETLYKLVRK